jgi:hypothetical protein
MPELRGDAMALALLVRARNLTLRKGRHVMKQNPIRLALAFAVLCALAGAAPAAAQVDPDEDTDGVTDAADLCPETPVDDFVDPDGCSICPCDEDANGDAWTSHEAYVACVATEARARRAARTLKRKAMRAAIKRARKAACGNEELTRCCVYAQLDDEAEVNFGQCRVTTVDACDDLSLREDLDWVEDMGSGSCTPNPCEF